MKKIREIFKFFFFCCVLSFFFSCLEKKEVELRVLQINLWHEGTAVPEGFEGIVDIIVQTDPDVVFLCEIRNRENVFIKRLIGALREKGLEYYGENPDMDSGILSKFPLLNPEIPFVLENGTKPVMKAQIEANGHHITLYSAHLDYTHYECYMPRGYSGTTWQKLDEPVTDASLVLEANRLSFRDEAIKAFIADARKEIEKGNMVMLAGDFNEPSHLDWQENTRDLFDHNGAVINWDCSVMLYENGYRDVYREKYPDVATYPGFTFPSANRGAEISKLTWAPEADERERIDFIYYYPTPEIRIKEVSIVGPSQSIAKGIEVESESRDSFIEPVGIWPTDHKALWTIFSVSKKQ